EAEPLLPVEPIDFVDDAIDVVIEAAALQLDLTMKFYERLDRAADLGQRIGLEPARRKPFDHAGLGFGRHRAHFAPGVGKKAERPRSGNRRILLAQRAGGGVARIGESLAAALGLPLVEQQKRA